MSPMFVPGPVDVAPEVLAAQAKPMMPHRSRDFDDLFRRTGERSKELFYTQFRVFQGPWTGSGMQEAGIRNFVRDRVLCCVNGAFASRWYDVALANGKNADQLEVDWGFAITPELLDKALAGHDYEAVTIVHNETSTGIENPVKELAEVIRAHNPDTLILVDAVSSLGGTKIEMDAWGIDFLFTSSQKCLALPPGMSLAATHDRALKKAQHVPNRGWYFDLLLMEDHRIKNSTPMTPTMPLIYALDLQLDRIQAEGLENRFLRHANMAKRVQTWAVEHGMSMVGDSKYLSKTVCCIQNNLGLSITDLNKFLLERGMRITNGYGKLKDKSFRIAAMGEIQMEDVEILLSNIEEFIAR